MTFVIQDTINQLASYCRDKPEISMAFLFGSYAKGKEMSESDMDVAVYFTPAHNALEWEENKEYPEEGKIWLDIEGIAGKNTDLVVLNRARAGLAFEILRTGIPIIVKDRNLYLRFLLLVSSAAEDFRTITSDWRLIKERATSMSAEDRSRLIRAVDFLESELAEISKFKDITHKEYEHDRDKRRNLERWVENIVNSSIDIAKIILASEKAPLPETYAAILQSLGKFSEFDPETASLLGEFAKLRNILAHEYLDVRFSKIRRFIEHAEKIYPNLTIFGKSRTH